MRTVIPPVLVPAVLLLAALPLAPAHAADGPARGATPVVRRLDGPGHWTASQMRQAEAHPRDLPAQGRAESKPVPPIVKAVVAQGHHKAPLKQIGRLYVTSTDGRRAYCSATVVNSAYPKKGRGNGSVVLTAAHCLEDKSDNWRARYVAFAPDQDKESTPYGLWSGYRTLMWSGWAKSLDVTYDYAFIALAKRDTGTVQQETNGQSIRFGTRKSRMWLRLYGYAAEYTPGNKPYADGGTVLRMCRGRSETVRRGGSKFLRLRCNLSHGASGGPLIADLKGGYGRIVGVVSHGLDTKATVLYSPVMDKWAQKLFFSIRTVKVPVWQDPDPGSVLRVP